ncbi:MAG: Clp1/GlmU family protein [Gammaproteobacteria bacterium]|nr:Clp1/GlmU family protein [Gammaproteobacteria bacterium]
MVMDAVATSFELCQHLQAGQRRLLVCGSPGSDRCTPVARLIQTLAAAGADYHCLAADPALPLFGVPGALNFGYWNVDGWLQLDREALCSLDSSRFRLPLVTGLSRLLERNSSRRLILQAPGLARGVAGAELLVELVRCARIDIVVLLSDGGSSVPLEQELQACGAEVVTLAEPGNGGISKQQRRQQRSQMWRDYLHAAIDLNLPLSDLQILGTPPPLEAADAWKGRQIALLNHGKLTTMGQVDCLQSNQLQVRVAAEAGPANQLLIRDALCINGQLRSARPYRKPPEKPPEPPSAGFLPEDTALSKETSCGPIPIARCGAASACLVNGVFGDPLLKLQLYHQRRSLLFDLGDTGRMSARIAHQVTDVFFSHTHADHVGGFLWFLRSRIGDLPPCRCYGPPGLAQQIAGMVNGILWDRVEERAPRFEVREWHGKRLRCYRVVAGETGAELLTEHPLEDGLLWREPGFSVRAAALDHGTLVLAYAYEPALQVRVRRDRLQALGLKSGRWLQELKQQLLQGHFDSSIALPDGSHRPVSQLQDELLLVSPGQKLVYATDFADTEDNRRRLTELARGAHSLFCEASFMLEHRDQARRTRHLTTTACAEIANAAGVTQLLPFHFSKRYIKRAPEVYREISRVCDRTIVPGFI